MQPKIKAKARCDDGEVGSISKVIVDPLSLEISHVVVREGDGQGVDRQVPIAQVQEIPNEEEIVLRGSLEEFRTYPVLDRDAYVSRIMTWKSPTWRIVSTWSPVKFSCLCPSSNRGCHAAAFS